MKDQLIDKFNEFNEESYYQKIDESINVILSSYTELRRNASLKPAEKQKMESELNEQITDIVYSSGLSSERDLPFNIEKEFFTNGELDEKRYNQFKFNILQHFSEEEQKWIFAGTSFSYTKITHRALESEKRSINELLPKDLLKENARASSNKTKSVKAGIPQLFVYPDGAISSVYEPSRARFSFDQTRDRSGVPWGRTYHADLVVEKQNWDSGFNSKGEWERFTLNNDTPSSTIETKSENPIVSFEPQIKDSMEYIYIIDLDDNRGVLCDEDGLLITEQNEQFFTLNGKLYAERKTNPQASAEKLITDLKQKGITNLSEIIVPDKTDETKSAYKTMLGDMVTDQTIFRAAGEPETHTAMLKLRDSIIENRAAAELISRFSMLTKQGYTGNLLYSGLEHNSNTSVLDHKLSLFTNKNDLEVFVSLPDISKSADMEILNYLKELQVPEEKASAMSNAVQNLLHDYENLFQYTGLNRKDVITYIFDTIVLGRNERSSKIIIPGECTLNEYIRQQAPDYRNTTVPVYHSSRATLEVPNVFSDEGFIEWQNVIPDLLNNEIAPGVKKILNNANLDHREQTAASAIIVSAFMEFKAIQESTGTTPAELTELIINQTKGKHDNSAGNKRILFSKNLDKLIYEASTGTKHSVNVSKNSIINYRKTDVKTSEYDLFNEDSFMEFVSTPVFKSYSLSKEEIKELSSAIKEISLPESEKKVFITNLMDVLPFYKSSLSVQGYNINKLIHDNASYSINKSKEVGSFAGFLGLGEIIESLNTPAENYIFAENFPSTVNKETVVNELKKASLSESQINTLLEQYKHEYSGLTETRLSRYRKVYDNMPIENAENSINFEQPGISDVAWKTIRKEGMEKPKIIRLQPSAGKKGPRIIASAMPNTYQTLSQSQSFQELTPNDFNSLNSSMIYTSPSVRPSGWASSIDHSILDHNNPDNFVKAAPQVYKQHTGYDSINDGDNNDSNMQRIIENYNYDRRKLAKTDSGGGSSGQSTSGSKDKGKGGDLKKTIEALYEELKNDIQKTY